MKKGFTLIELVAVIIVLALLGFIIIPTVSGVISDNKERLHNQQIELLKKNANTYASSNIDKLKTYDGAKNILTIKDLYEAGVIQNEVMIDPLTDQEITGCLVLIWSDEIKQFDINYIDPCLRSATLTGKITESNNPIVANVYLLENNEIAYETTTDANGNYSFSNVNVGTYILLASQQYKTKYGEELEINDSNVVKNMNVKFYKPDYNNDGLVNQYDTKHFESCWNGWRFYNTQYEGCFEREMYDIDNDTALTIGDQALVSQRWITEIKYLDNGRFNINGHINDLGEEIMEAWFANNSIKLKTNTETFSAPIDDNGNFSFTNLPKNNYYIDILIPDYGVYYKTFTLGEDIDYLDINIYKGDLNGDRFIDEEDITLMERAVTRGLKPTGTRECYDLNGDGVIDKIDLTMLKQNMYHFQESMQ